MRPNETNRGGYGSVTSGRVVVLIGLLLLSLLGLTRVAQADLSLPETKLAASDGAGGDSFGWSVGASADGTTAIVGSVGGDTAAGANTGAAYVVRKSGGFWSQVAKLEASGGGIIDLFGHAVALSADGTTAVVVAPFDDTSAGADAGSFYVYRESGGVWTEDAKLTALDAAAYDHFGSSVAVSADGATAIIGAYRDDTAAGLDVGSAYVFREHGGFWSQVVKLTASDGAPNDHFGWSVSMSADGTTAVIGAVLDETASGSQTGSAYVFRERDGVWTEVAKLTAGGGGHGDYFGSSVALSADGTTTVVGAPYDDASAGVNAGSAYLFRENGGAWREVAMLTASDGALEDYFGNSVAVTADGATAVVGAPYDDTALGVDAGSVHIFQEDDGGWTEVGKVTASDGALDDSFGSSVALSRDGTTTVVGAFHDDTVAGVDAGSAYVYDLAAIIPPAAPTGLAASASSSAVSLDWTANPEADLAGYHVYRSTDGGPFSQLTSGAPVTSSSYLDGEAPVDVPLSYYVTAVDVSANESDPSETVSVVRPAAATPPVDTGMATLGAFERTWERADQPVATGQAARTWMWGPEPFTTVLLEDYLESPEGQRQVQYFDKSRMEITHPDAVDDGLWYVTNGLLVVELITGDMQVGDGTFVNRGPAEVNVAGDPGTGPTYAVLGPRLADAPLGEGTTITRRLHADGSVTDDASLAGREVTAGHYVDATNHTVAEPFWTFMNSAGVVFEDGTYVEDQLFINPFYATGFPITEAYWTQVTVGGTPTDVLVQCFERRCLTYTPDNPAGWRVEAGNVGQHYYRWRYGSLP